MSKKNKALSALKKIISTGKAVPAGVKDYWAKNRAIHQEAKEEVGLEQKDRIARVNQGESVTPYGTNEFYGKAKDKVKELKKNRGISLRNSIREKRDEEIKAMPAPPVMRKVKQG